MFIQFHRVHAPLWLANGRYGLGVNTHSCTYLQYNDGLAYFLRKGKAVFFLMPQGRDFSTATSDE